MTNDIERDPAYSDDNLIWIDMEMTGLQPEVNRVIEVAAIITDKNLNILHKGPVVAVHQSDEVLDGMDAWNTDTHTRSGLVARVKESTIDEAECEKIFLETFRRFVPQGKSPMCGNTIGQDPQGAHPPLGSRKDAQHPEGHEAPGPLRHRGKHRGASVLPPRDPEDLTDGPHLN